MGPVELLPAQDVVTAPAGLPIIPTVHTILPIIQRAVRITLPPIPTVATTAAVRTVAAAVEARVQAEAPAVVAAVAVAEVTAVVEDNLLFSF